MNSHAIDIRNANTSDSIFVYGCEFKRINSTALYLEGGDRFVATIKNSKIQYAHSGIYAHQPPTLTIDRCLFSHNHMGISAYHTNAYITGSLLISNSTMTNNVSGLDLGYDNDSYFSSVVIMNSILKNNSIIEVDHYGPVVFSYSALEFGESAFNSVGDNSSTLLENCVTSGIGPISENGVLTSNSSAVDSGDPFENDGYMPPGLGLVRRDMGMYGGPGNVYWGGEGIPEGDPVIDNIVDLPQDQGGSVGIQYSASIFDYQHSAMIF